MGDGKSTVAQTPPFRLEPLLEVLRGGKQVHDLALTHHHHRVREIDRERLPKPPKDWPTASCWTEPFHLTAHSPRGILTIRSPEIVRRMRWRTRRPLASHSNTAE
jgi:hypothetical protein